MLQHQTCNQFMTAFFSGHNYWPRIDELRIFCLVVNNPVAHCRFATSDSGFWFNYLYFADGRKRILQVKQDRQFTCNVTLLRVRVTIVAVEEQ